MKKRIIFLLLFFAISCSPIKNTPQDYAQIKVIDVIDGDTVKLADGKLLRYIGLDTPELHIKKNNTFIYSPQPFSQEAKQLNQTLVENKLIRIEFDMEKFDKYGRLLGYCFIENTFINAKLLEEGLAVIYTKPPNVKYSDLFLKKQKQARENKKGLWREHKTINAQKANLYINQIQTVTGTVLNTYKSKNCVFLNFGRDYKTDFTVVIFNNTLKYFKNKGINPETFYRGKTIRVTGRIKEYNGPEIVVNLPDEIEILN